MIAVQAYRNLFRRKRRSFVTASSIAFGLWLAVLYIGTRENGYEQFIKVSAQTGFGSVTMADPRFTDAGSDRGVIVIDPQVIDAVKAEHDVSMVVPRIIGDAVANTGLASTGAGFVAVDPQTDKGEINLFSERLVEGRWLADDQAAEAVIGKVMAQRLGLHPGDDLIYTTVDATRNAVSLMATVVGIFNTGNDDIDGHSFVLPRGHLIKDLSYPAGSASFAAIYFKHAESVDPFFKQVAPRYQTAKMKFFHWQETQPDLANFMAADRLVYRIMLFFVGIIIASGVFTCMIMSVIERRRELGTMLALGSSPLFLFNLITIESIILAFFGCILGVIVVAPFFYYLNVHGIDLTQAVGGSLSVGGVTRDRVILSCSLSNASAAVIIAGLFILSMLSAAYPAAKAALTIPIKTIRD